MSTLRTLGAAAAALLVTGAMAGNAAAKDGFYVGSSLGWVLPNSVDLQAGTTSGKADFDNGWAFYAASGYRFDQFRVEGELGYGQSSGGSITLGTTTTEFDADQTFWSGTLAGYVDFDAGQFQPYVGGGVGFITADVDDLTIGGVALDGLSGSDTNLQMFGEAGVAYAVNDQLSIVPSYRYLWVNDGGDGVDDTTAHVVRIGVRYTF